MLELGHTVKSFAHVALHFTDLQGHTCTVAVLAADQGSLGQPGCSTYCRSRQACDELQRSMRCMLTHCEGGNRWRPAKHALDSQWMQVSLPQAARTCSHPRTLGKV